MESLPVSALFEALTETMTAEEVVASTWKAHIAAQIMNWRLRHEMNQAEFAAFCNVSQSTVSKWENGEANFTIEKLAAIAVKLDLELSVLLESPKTNRTQVRRSTTVDKWNKQSKVLSADFKTEKEKVVSIFSSSSYHREYKKRNAYEELKEE